MLIYSGIEKVCIVSDAINLTAKQTKNEPLFTNLVVVSFLHKSNMETTFISFFFSCFGFQFLIFSFYSEEIFINCE